MAMRVAARVVEQRLNADTSDHAGPMLPCACGQSARYAGRHGKNFESVLGPLRLERAYYHCELCEAGFCPRDRVLGLEGGSLSPGVLRMAGLVGAMVSFEEGHEINYHPQSGWFDEGPSKGPPPCGRGLKPPEVLLLLVFFLFLLVADVVPNNGLV